MSTEDRRQLLRPGPSLYKVAADSPPPNSQRAKVTDAGGGRMVREAIPNLPSERWINSAGNVVVMPVHTCRDLSERTGTPMSGAAYGAWIRSSKMRDGWVNYETGMGAPAEYLQDWPARREELISSMRAKYEKEYLDGGWARLATKQLEHEMARITEGMARGVEQMLDKRDAERAQQERPARGRPPKGEE